MNQRNAVILAAGISSRFVPLSFEMPKGLLKVKGEILIERQIRQLREAGVQEIIVVVGYQKEKFYYLQEKYNVTIVVNEDYERYNNTSSMIRILDYLTNTYICSSDNYFTENIFLTPAKESYYSAIYQTGKTEEYCIQYDEEEYITAVNIGGQDSYIMLGAVYFHQDFSRKFKSILEKEYQKEETRKLLWEQVYMKYLPELKMKIQKYSEGIIYEFDSLDELRVFEPNFQSNSKMIEEIMKKFSCKEEELLHFTLLERNEKIYSFEFTYLQERYVYTWNRITGKKDINMISW